MKIVQIVMVVIAGSAMGTTVEELKREVGKLKGHILSQVEKCNADSLVTTFSGRGADEGEKGNGKFQIFCFRFCRISAFDIIIIDHQTSLFNQSEES